MTEQFDLEALEKALAPKKKTGGKPDTKKEEHKPEAKKRNSNKPLFVAVNKKGKEVGPGEIKRREAYGLRVNQ
jgi:hypothetical protein